MVYEDLTTFSETDPSNHWSQTTTRSTATGLTRAEDSHVSKSYGANHFTSSLEHLVDLYFDRVASGSKINFYVWTLTDTPSSYADAANNTLWSQCYYDGGTAYRLGIIEAGVGSDTYNMTIDTMYYCTLKRDGATFTNKIYSDAARTTLLDTLTLTTGEGSFEYLQCGASREIAGGDCDGYSENYDLQEAVAAIASRRLLVGVGR